VNRAARRGFGIVIVAALVVTSFVLSRRSVLQEEVDEAAQVAAALEAELEETEREVEATSEELADLQETSSTYALLLRERAEFVAAIDKAEAAFAKAKGEVDTADERNRILRLQQKVLGEREDASAVDAASREVVKVAAGVAREVAARIEERRLAALQSASQSGAWSGGSATATSTSGGGHARVRAALDRVGGRGFALKRYSGSCSGVRAPACASPGGVIYYAPEVARWSTARLHWVMAHELAHQYQFRVWNKLVASSGYRSLFGSNIELLANCMAHQRGYPSGRVSCSGKQLTWAGSIWRGSVPG
jgi:hypothetical protein